MSNLVIVESPAKAKTIGKFLGSRFKVIASVGHVRDLPKSTMGVDIQNNFEPKYINIRGKGDTIKALKAAAKKADKVYLATDPDREGEAIAWHLSYILGLNTDEKNRVVFREITKDSVKAAIKTSRSIDQRLVDAQQARRILDRLVGYSISPILWRKVKKGLSAGRVQSVATKLICDREKEIKAFIPKEYWSIDLETITDKKEKVKFSYYGKDIKKKFVPENEEQIEKITSTVTKKLDVIKVEKKSRKRSALPPYTTSTLQQDASIRLGFSTKKTMSIAQQLYEGISVKGQGTLGLITYMRTDSTRVADFAKSQAIDFIKEQYGENYIGSGRRSAKSKSKSMQDAHEAIRPTRVGFVPRDIAVDLSKDQLKLYDLIWTRFVASNMADTIYESTTIMADSGGNIFKANGSIVTFDGFSMLYTYGKDGDMIIPDINEGQQLSIKKVLPEQHFTLPPPRFTEASLVKQMEENGIGRPSTYAPTISTILARNYVTKEKKSLYPTELGLIINEIMANYFTNVINTDFTAGMESRFDDIENGDQEWKPVISEFYGQFDPMLKKADSELDKIDITEKTDIPCPKCGKLLLIRDGRYGKFYACPGYPECEYTKPVLKTIGLDCPKCGKGDVVVRKTKKFRNFYGCSEFPNCDFVSWNMPVDQRCEVCGQIKVKMANKSIVCIDKNCKSNEKPTSTKKSKNK